MLAFTRLSLARQYLMASFAILFCGMLIIGYWVGKQIEIGVTNRTATITAGYVDSLVSHHLQYVLHPEISDDDHETEILSILTSSSLARNIVFYKIWDPNGVVLYSTDPALVGKKYPVGDGLEEALTGSVHAGISNLDNDENIAQQERSKLMEIYAPLRFEGEIIAVIEFYQTLDELNNEIWSAQQRSWVIVGVSTILIYLSLAGLVGRASSTILSQQNELHVKVSQLTKLLEQNKLLHNRVSRAASRTTALNERFLNRISADLHDGPGQDIALALLRIDELASLCETCKVSIAKRQVANDDIFTIESALKAALSDMRSLLAGLRLPDIEQLSVRDVVERATRDYERKTSVAVKMMVNGIPDSVPLSVKITLYRILQESLTNGYRHANGANQQVSVLGHENQLIVEVSDNGPGFDKQIVHKVNHLGLAGMRERVEILGGKFELETGDNSGTLIRAHLPLTFLEVVDE
ncbi:MAG TPA: sensor histidine kinase [Anaerolineales bacterium]|nr:sensor histidine kinase [Anaerolineales bacterium]